MKFVRSVGSRSMTFAVLLVSVATMAAKPVNPPQKIQVTASKFQFEPNQITVKKGEPVTIVLTSNDVTHGLKIPDLHVEDTVKKGDFTELNFTPDKTGTFQGKCAHFCGKGHGMMTFTVTVVE
jgi:cytochrome c oxidase subunit II